MEEYVTEHGYSSLKKSCYAKIGDKKKHCKVVVYDESEELAIKKAKQIIKFIKINNQNQ